MAEKNEATTPQVSEDVAKRYKELQEKMDALASQMSEVQNDNPVMPSNVTPLDMNNFAELVGTQIREALKGQSVIDRKFGALPGDSAEDLKNLDPKERTLRFIKGVFFKDHAAAVKYGGGAFLKEKGLTEGTTTAGGYLVPDEFRAEVLRLANIYGLARRQCRIVPMKRDKVNFPAAGGTGVTAYWVDEAGTINDSTPNFSQVQLDTKKCCGLTILSNELVADAEVDTLGYIIELFAEAIAKAEDTQWLAGTGSPITGLLGSSSVNVITMGAGKTGFSNISFDDLLDMENALTAAEQIGEQFYLNNNILTYLRKLKDNEGRYIFSPPAQGQPGTLWGIPYNITDVMPGTSSSAAETKFMALGNPKYTLLGDRKQITIDVSTEAYIDTTSLFQTDQQAVRVIERVDIQLGIAGAYAVLKTAAA